MHVAVFGLGYVGTVTATCLASRGHQVVGIDVDEQKVTAVARGRSPVVEPGLDAVLAQVVCDIGAALAGSIRPHTVVIRSTVPPGTVDDVVIPALEAASGRRVGEGVVREQARAALPGARGRLPRGDGGVRPGSPAQHLAGLPAPRWPTSVFPHRKQNR